MFNISFCYIYLNILSNKYKIKIKWIGKYFALGLTDWEELLKSKTPGLFNSELCFLVTRQQEGFMEDHAFNMHLAISFLIVTVGT